MLCPAHQTSGERSEEVWRLISIGSFSLCVRGTRSERSWLHVDARCSSSSSRPAWLELPSAAAGCTSVASVPPRRGDISASQLQEEVR